MASELAKYKSDSGNEITLTFDNIRNMICDDPNVTDKECLTFAALCKSHKIDPFIREAYLVKYGNRPAQMIVGKDYWMKQAGMNPQFDGLEAGVTVITRNGELVRREGSLVGGSTERLVGGWARVYRKDRDHPSFAEVAFDEYSTGKSMWKPASQGGKPATLIRKVAVVQALREAFPDTFSGLYDSSEMGMDGFKEQPPVEVDAVEEPEPVMEPEPITEAEYEIQQDEAYADYAAEMADEGSF